MKTPTAQGFPEGRSRGVRMQRPLTRLAPRLAAAAAMLTVATIAHAAETRVIYVDKSAPPGGDGTSWDKAFRSPQAAFNQATEVPSEAMQIRIAQGVYKPSESEDGRWTPFSCAPMFVQTSLAVMGSYAGRGASDPNRRDYQGTRTIFCGDLKDDDGPGQSNRSDNTIEILRISVFGRLEIDGLTIRRATADDELNTSSALTAKCYSTPLDPLTGAITLSNCDFEDNIGGTDSPGGALLLCDTSNIFGCGFRRNAAPSGNGGGLRVNMPPMRSGLMQQCVFESNSAVFGGGLFAQSMDVYSTVFVGNAAIVQGGGAFGSRLIESCLFVRNRADSSGGAVAGTPYSIRTSTFVDNQAPLGGALSTYNSAVWFDSNIVWSIQAYPRQQIRLADCIDAPSIYGSLIQGGASAIMVSGFGLKDGSQFVDAEPMFVRPAATTDAPSNWRTWNYRLRPQSPAITLGSKNWAIGVDLDGRQFLSWRTSRRPDAGCYWLTTTDCLADLDRSGELVDDSDFQLFAAAYDLTIAPPANPLADLNNDGLVDDADFSLFAVAYDAMVCP